jgi:alpha-beta hydrolase superfamily lysophospholipase
MNSLKFLAGSSVQYRVWPCPKPKAILLLIHGLGAHTERWNFLAEYFKKQRFASYALALQGFDETPGIRGHIHSFQEYYSAIQALTSLIQKKHPRLPLILIGESMGGLIALRMVEQHPSHYHSLIVFSPAIQSAMTFPLSSYLKVVTGAIFKPTLPIPQPFTAAMCTQDEKYLKVMEKDPRELRIASVKLLLGILGEQTKVKQESSTLQKPLLIQCSGQDQLVKTSATQDFFNHLATKDKTLIIYPEMKHALSIEKNRLRVFKDMQAWIKKHMK